MVYLDEFLALTAIHLCALIIPGPDFALVMHQAVSKGKRQAVVASLGIVTGLSLHILYTLLGVGILISQSKAVFTVVEVLGAIYLAYIAVSLLRVKDRLAGCEHEFFELSKQSMQEPFRQVFVKGFLCNVFNPKVTLFFLAIFTSIVDRKTPIGIQTFYGLWMIVTAFVWFLLVTFLFSQESVRAKFFAMGGWFERITGVVIMSFSIKLAVDVVQAWV